MKNLLARFTSLDKRSKMLSAVVGIIVVLGVVAVALGAAGVVDTAALFGTSSTQHVCVKATINKIEVHDDADPWGSGELWFWFGIVGDQGRVLFAGEIFPDGGKLDWSSGDTYDVNKSIKACQQLPFSPDNPSVDLTLVIEGWDEDWPPEDPNDDLGKVEVTHGDVWGWRQHTGSYSTRSTCPDGCFTLHYTIEWYYD